MAISFEVSKVDSEYNDMIAEERRDTYMTNEQAEYFWGTMHPAVFTHYLNGGSNCLDEKRLYILQKNIVKFRKSYLEANGEKLEEYFENDNIPTYEYVYDIVHKGEM